MIYDRSIMERTFMMHSSLPGGSCICGWRRTEMSKFYVHHVLDEYEQWIFQNGELDERTD